MQKTRSTLQRTLTLALGLAALLPLGCKKSDAGQGAQQAAGPGAVAGPAGGNLLKASNFEDGRSLPWMASYSPPAAGEAAIENGAYCIKVENKGTNRWDAQVRHREMVIQSGHKYTVQFRAWASVETKAYPKIGMAGPPYTEYFGRLITITTTPQVFQAQFSGGTTDDPTAEFAFHVGGGLAKAVPLTVCFDDLFLSDEQYTPPPVEEVAPPPSVRVNQHGYLPTRQKFATVVNASTSELTWELLGADGTPVTSGETTVVGADEYSGDNVHIVDFSAFTTAGKSYVLKVGDGQSDPFDIGKDVYAQLKIDALAYFYHNRSGIAIEMPYAREEQWARPAGHPEDKVTCAPGPILKKTGWYDGAGCSYTLDVTGGWYDAGDHGKYVVNGGVAVWTLLNQYERAKAMGGDVKALGDKKLNIPESGNGVPDILDEARWQLDFMLSMQAPEGDKAGMVHHKMHDEHWTALGLAPHEDPEKRYLRPVSTAATLNVAATAAQCARIWRAIDAKYSAKCLTAAERAWTAANKFPELYAPGTDNQDGGGPYDDNQLEDDFYWAAAELYVTTGKPAYLAALTKNKYHAALIGGDGKESIFNWKDTDGLGAITLATVPSKLKKADVDAQRARLTAVADKYLAHQGSDGYGLPFAPRGAEYPWGSNSFVINNAMVMALAYDFTKDAKYLDGVSKAMDYLLGRNAMAQSYVTGYGERPLMNPHHRFWAKQANDRFPGPPPGIVSGGPNSGLQDPYVKAAGLQGCKPQKCFLDHIEAWSVNEITINWNAPFAWVAAFLDEHGAK
jgi:endoglucanase